MPDIYKKHIIDSEGNYKIGYYPESQNNEFQKFVNEDKPSYVAWLAVPNTPEEIPYTPQPEPPELPLEKLRAVVISKISNKKSNTLDGGFEFGGLQIATDKETREFILGGARKAKKDNSFEIEAVLGDGSVVTLTNQQLKDLEDAFDEFGTTVHELFVSEYKTALTADRDSLQYYSDNGEFE